LLAVLEELGRRFGHPGRIYLAGSSALIWEGLRTESVDIDYAAEVDDVWEAELSRVIREVKDRMQVNLELASPGDFIPLPPGWRDRSPWLGRYGALDVHGFDPYATALTKLLRGRASDIEDVSGLLRQGTIEHAQLARWADWLVDQVRLNGWHAAGDREEVRAKLDASLARCEELLAQG